MATELQDRVSFLNCISLLREKDNNKAGESYWEIVYFLICILKSQSRISSPYWETVSILPKDSSSLFTQL